MALVTNNGYTYTRHNVLLSPSMKRDLQYTAIDCGINESEFTRRCLQWGLDNPDKVAEMSEVGVNQ